MQLPNSQLPTATTAPPNPTARGPTRIHPPWNSPAVPAAEFQSWWIHLWSGLVRDPAGRHYKKMGNAVWLYLFLLIGANRTTGIVLRKQETIALQTGFNERSVARWMQDLRDEGYITTDSNGRSLRIQITKWRPPSAARLAKKQN